MEVDIFQERKEFIQEVIDRYVGLKGVERIKYISKIKEINKKYPLKQQIINHDNRN